MEVLHRHNLGQHFPTCKRQQNTLPVLENDLVNQPVFLRLLGVHDEIALHVALDLFQDLAAVFGQQLVGDLTHAENFARLNIDIGRLSGDASAHNQRLVNQDARRRQGEPLFRARRPPAAAQPCWPPAQCRW